MIKVPTIERQHTLVSLKPTSPRCPRTGKTQPRDHEDCAAEDGFHSLSHYNLVESLPAAPPEETPNYAANTFGKKFSIGFPLKKVVCTRSRADLTPVAPSRSAWPLGWYHRKKGAC